MGKYEDYLNEMSDILGRDGLPVADKFIDLMEENWRLTGAIARAGFAVMQTSGYWSIHDVSKLAKKEQEKTVEVINQNIGLEIQNTRLMEELKEAMLGMGEQAAKIKQLEAQLEKQHLKSGNIERHRFRLWAALDELDRYCSQEPGYSGSSCGTRVREALDWKPEKPLQTLGEALADLQGKLFGEDSLPPKEERTGSWWCGTCNQDRVGGTLPEGYDDAEHNSYK